MATEFNTKQKKEVAQCDKTPGKTFLSFRIHFFFIHIIIFFYFIRQKRNKKSFLLFFSIGNKFSRRAFFRDVGKKKQLSFGSGVSLFFFLSIRSPSHHFVILHFFPIHAVYCADSILFLVENTFLFCLLVALTTLSFSFFLKKDNMVTDHLLFFCFIHYETTAGNLFFQSKCLSEKKSICFVPTISSLCCSFLGFPNRKLCSLDERSRKEKNCISSLTMGEKKKKR